MLRTLSSESPPSEDSELTLGPDAKDIDFSAVSTEELVNALKKRVDGLLLITFEHCTKPGPDGAFFWKGSSTILRGLKDQLVEETNDLLYNGGEDEEPSGPV